MPRPAPVVVLRAVPHLVALEDRVVPVFTPSATFPNFTPALGTIDGDGFDAFNFSRIEFTVRRDESNASSVQLQDGLRSRPNDEGDPIQLTTSGNQRVGSTFITLRDEGYYVVRFLVQFPTNSEPPSILDDERDVILIDVTDPTITPIADVATLPSGDATTIPFTIGDNFTSPDTTTAFGRASLVVTSASSNERLVPAANVVLSGSGARRTLQITPIRGETGTSTIRVLVTDEAGNVGVQRFNYTVRRNGAPTLTAVPDQALAPGAASGPLSFTVDDDVTPASQLRVTATSSNGRLIPATGVALAGTAAARTVTVTPAAGQTGTSDITLAVTDANELTTTASFRVTVAAANAPTITALGDVSIQVGEAVPEITFDIADDAPTAGLTPTVVSSDPRLLDASGIRFTVVQGADLNTSRYQLVLTPNTGQTGATTVTIAVTDAAGLTATETFVLSVGDAPTATQRTRIAAVGAGAGGGPRVRVVDDAGVLRFDMMVFEETFTGGVRVAVGDVNGDGTDDFIAAAGPGGQSRVRVLNGVSGTTIADFYAYELSFFGGTTVAVADLDGDGFDDVVVGTSSTADADGGAGPRVRVFSGSALTANGGVGVTSVKDFFAFDDEFRGGVRVALADVNGDGLVDIVTAPGPSGSPEVRVYDAVFNADAKLQSKFTATAFGADYLGGLSVAALNGAVVVAPDSFPNFPDSFLDQRFATLANIDGQLLTGSATAANLTRPAQTAVYTFQGNTATLTQSDPVLDPSFQGGVRIAAGEYAGQRGVIIASGPGGGGRVQFRPAGPAGGNAQLLPPLDLPLLDFPVSDNGFMGGVYAAVAAERVGQSV